MEAGYDVYEYSRTNRLADLQEALNSGVEADLYMAYDGSTALVIAARQGHGNIVRELLKHGADATRHTEEGSSMLHHAVSGNSPEAAMAFLDAGLNVNEPNEDGVVPLILAAHYGFVDVVRLLCDRGADMNLAAEGWGTALDSATGDTAEFLEHRGAMRSSSGKDQPLAAASERFHYGCFESGENPHTVPVAAPAATQQRKPEESRQRPAVGDFVRLIRPKAGVLGEGDVGAVVHDDGSDCVPLKVRVGEAHDYYDYDDVVVCLPVVELPPDSDRATPEGTKRRLSSCSAASQLGVTGLHISPVGFGCHRLDDDGRQRTALELAIQMNCNLIDVAPNYTNGVAECVVGSVLQKLFDEKKARRDEVVLVTKVGNVLGQQLQHAAGVPGMERVNDNLSHCISPEWIEQEITRSLERLHLKCIDCLLLHCPEYESRMPGVEMDEVYKRLGAAFCHLEKEVAQGRIQMYGVSAAFVPLRPTDPEHLDLEAVMAQLPEGHHFRVLQFPLNYAEAPILWLGHTQRNPDGTAVDKDKVLDSLPLLESAKAHGLATMINRPLDGIFKESHGVLRFSSLDCQARSFSELQLDNCDVLEEKLTKLCRLDREPFNAGDGSLSSKTVKVLASLRDVDCVLLGMRQPEYVLDALPLSMLTPSLEAEVALGAVRALHNTVSMWFATAIHEPDHGTSKTWRLSVDERYPVAGEAAGG